MNVLPLSDLHLEFGVPPDIDGGLVSLADVIVLAGDIHLGTKGIEWAAKAFPDKQVIYVPGNHEYYGGHIHHTATEMQEIANELGIAYLDNKAITINGVRFIGSTLWTDFKLFGIANEWFCLQAAKRLNDFDGQIRGRQPGGVRPYFLAHQSAQCHATAKAFIRRELDTCLLTGEQSVVVTHHAPSMKSVAPRFEKDLFSACFASNLDGLVSKADLWLHGHTHDSFDYNIPGERSGRVFCNPRGYVTPRHSERDWRPEVIPLP
jgi:predicted phosphodiesterase